MTDLEKVTKNLMELNNHILSKMDEDLKTLRENQSRCEDYLDNSGYQFGIECPKCGGSLCKRMIKDSVVYDCLEECKDQISKEAVRKNEIN